MPHMTVEVLMLVALMVLSVWQDWRYRRIPNRLLQVFALMALMLSLLPSGLGLFSALGAAAVGAAAFSPMYLLRQMGAGDLKLMATTGLLVGMPGIAALCLSVAMAGGLLALYWLWLMPRQTANDRSSPMPYAVAIALGSAAHGMLTPFLTI